MTDSNNPPNGADQLRAIVTRIESAQEDIDAAKLDLKEIYSEAKGAGFDTRTLRKVIARRKKGQPAVREEEELLALYEGVINDQLPLPLDEVA